MMKSRIWKKAAAVLLSAAILFTAAGCGTDGPESQVAKVNDTVITKAQFDNYTMLCLYTMGYDPSEQLTSEEEEEMLGDMVDAEVLRQYYEENDPSVFSDAYQSGLQAYIAQTKQDNGEFINSSGISDEDITFYYRSQYLTQLCFNEIQEENSDEELYSEAESYYEEHQEDFGGETLDEALSEIYYLLYSDMYEEKLDEIKENMSVIE